MAEDFAAPGKYGTLLKIRVSPGAANTAFAGLYGEGSAKLRVAAPPENGRANAEATRFLAESLGVSRSSVEVVRGGGFRDKVVLIRDKSPGVVRDRISCAIHAG